MSEPLQALIAGAGIGGLAAAVALKNKGWQLHILEQSAQLSEVGAGIQIGPNVTRILRSWGLQAPLLACSVEPERLVARHARQGHALGVLPLGQAMRDRFGAPYLTIHRAHLHRLLLQAVDAQVSLNHTVASVRVGDDVQVHTQTALGTQSWTAPLLIGADGLWSQVREAVWHDGPPRATGHVAYRALIAMKDLPMAMRSSQVTVWLGPALHVVQYPVHDPVQGGEALNVVVIAHHSAPSPQGWDHMATGQELQAATSQVCAPLRTLLDAMPVWRRWALFDRAPLASAGPMAHGGVALLGDAAHPMRPYLAQGAGMAIEDAQVLAQCLGGARTPHLKDALQGYAALRWQRNARVQARAQRNGRIFHLQPPASWARDGALRMAGPRLMNLPWLYGYTAPGT